MNLFIDAYYGDDIDLKEKEIKYIKEMAIEWIRYVLNGNEFDTSLKESFEVKERLINKYLFKEKLVPFKECINRELYDMYQDIPKEEIGSINELNGVEYEEFLKITKKYIQEESIINKKLNTTIQRYILYIDKLPIGEVGIRTTLNNFWQSRGSQIYYKLRKSQRGKGYGNLILSLVLKEAKKIGFKKIRINCDDRNIKSKKVILINGGKEDILSYKTEKGYSTSYLINLETIDNKKTN